jgi:hypothetical protein
MLATRSITDDKISQLKVELLNADWSDVQNAENANLAYEYFLDRFNKIYDHVMPVTNK